MSWNGSGGGKQERTNKCGKTSHFGGKSLLVCLTIVFVIGLVIWLMASKARTSSAPIAKETVKHIQKKTLMMPTAVISNRVMTSIPAVPKKETPKFEKRPGALQLPNGRVLTFPPPKEGETRKVYANGRMYECDHLGNFTDVTKRKLFRTAFENNFLGLACEGKQFIPAFLKGLDQEEVKKILVKNYQPIGDETPEELAQLKAYDDMRCVALDYMDQGGKFDDFVDEFATFERKQRESRAMSLREVMTLYKEGKIVEAKEMAEAASILLEKKGYKPLFLPPHVTESFSKIPNNQ